MFSNILIQDYLSLRTEIDTHCKELQSLHTQHMMCRAGCDQCCMDFSILPVEYYSILQEAGDDLKKGRVTNDDQACPFLVDHRCTIYNARPIICRTQGLPIVFMVDEQLELSACELNFTDYDFEEFSEDNTFPQDNYNSRLFLINKRFIETFPGKPYGMIDLIPVRSLIDDTAIDQYKRYR